MFIYHLFAHIFSVDKAHPSPEDDSFLLVFILGVVWEEWGVVCLTLINFLAFPVHLYISPQEIAQLIVTECLPTELS